MSHGETETEPNESSTKIIKERDMSMLTPNQQKSSKNQQKKEKKNLPVEANEKPTINILEAPLQLKRSLSLVLCSRKSSVFLLLLKALSGILSILTSKPKEVPLAALSRKVKTLFSSLTATAMGSLYRKIPLPLLSSMGKSLYLSRSAQNQTSPPA